MEEQNLLDKLLENKNIQELKNYDLKLQIMYYTRLKNWLIEFGKTQSIEDIEKYFSIEDKYIERYLLFKQQGILQKGFDCDHLNYIPQKSSPSFDTIGITDAFFERYFDYKKEYSKDTIFSMQYIWGQVVENLCDIKRNDYICQLKNIKIIKEKMGDKLFNCFVDYAHYYHTIGNMSPCPMPPFNSTKGSIYGNFDRLDLFLKKIREWSKWFYNDSYNTEYSDRVTKYGLNILIDNDLPEIVPIPKNLEDKETIQELIEYLEKVVELIKNRADYLIEEVIKREKKL